MVLLELKVRTFQRHSFEDQHSLFRKRVQAANGRHLENSDLFSAPFVSLANSSVIVTGLKLFDLKFESLVLQSLLSRNCIWELCGVYM